MNHTGKAFNHLHTLKTRKRALSTEQTKAKESLAWERRKRKKLENELNNCQSKIQSHIAKAALLVEESAILDCKIAKAELALTMHSNRFASKHGNANILDDQGSFSMVEAVVLNGWASWWGTPCFYNMRCVNKQFHETIDRLLPRWEMQTRCTLEDGDLVASLPSNAIDLNGKPKPPHKRIGKALWTKIKASHKMRKWATSEILWCRVYKQWHQGMRTYILLPNFSMKELAEIAIVINPKIKIPTHECRVPWLCAFYHSNNLRHYNRNGMWSYKVYKYKG